MGCFKMPARMNRSLLIKLTVVLMLAWSCVWLQAIGNRATTGKHTVAKGNWGGEHIILEVSGSGAEVEFDCARGKITRPLKPDRHGNFDVPGTFTPEHGGPVRRDEVTTPAPARYSGHTEGDAMTLTVTLAKEKLGPFTLTRNAHPMLRKCR
jgi:hypothetical protein